MTPFLLPRKGKTPPGKKERLRGERRIGRRERIGESLGRVRLPDSLGPISESAFYTGIGVGSYLVRGAKPLPDIRRRYPRICKSTDRVPHRPLSDYSNLLHPSLAYLASLGPRGFDDSRPYGPEPHRPSARGVEGSRAPYVWPTSPELSGLSYGCLPPLPRNHTTW